MTIRSRSLGAEIVVSDDVNLKPLIKSVREDAERYEQHAAMKAKPDYMPPVWPNAPLSYQARRG